MDSFSWILTVNLKRVIFFFFFFFLLFFSFCHPPPSLFIYIPPWNSPTMPLINLIFEDAREPLLERISREWTGRRINIFLCTMILYGTHLGEIDLQCAATGVYVCSVKCLLRSRRRFHWVKRDHRRIRLRIHIHIYLCSNTKRKILSEGKRISNLWNVNFNLFLDF